ncbi:MAG: hypothetical protein ABI972_09120 [Acidobacteriota bacterium]
MTALRLVCVLAVASGAFGECRTFGTADRKVVNIECQQAGPSSPEKILVDYLKQNPEPALMVVRVFGDRATAQQFGRELTCGDYCFSSWYKEALNFPPFPVEVSESVLFQGMITTRRRSGTSVNSSQQKWREPVSGCKLPVDASYPWAHTAIRELGPTAYRASGPIRTSIDLFAVTSTLLPADDYGEWVKTLSMCMPLASVQVHVRRDPFFVDDSEYPVLNPFFYGVPISEKSILSTPTISCRTVPGTLDTRCFEYAYRGEISDDIELKQ